MISFENFVGQRVNIETIDETQITGVVYSFNPKNHVVSIVSDSPKNNVTDFKVLKLNYIKEFTSANGKKPNKTFVSADVKHPLSASFVPPDTTHSYFKQVNSSGVSKFVLQRILQRKENISSEGKEVFKNLFTLLPAGQVGFNGDDIVVFKDELRITKPYRPEDCKSEDTGTLSYIQNHVAQVWDQLENERKGG